MEISKAVASAIKQRLTTFAQRISPAIRCERRSVQVGDHVQRRKLADEPRPLTLGGWTEFRRAVRHDGIWPRLVPVERTFSRIAGQYLHSCWFRTTAAPDRLVEVGDGAIVIALALPGVGAAVEGQGVVRIETYGLAVSRRWRGPRRPWRDTQPIPTTTP